jgi:autotransporter-associated beta strand protein
VTGVGSTGNGGTSNSSAAAIRSEATSGTNTVSAPINLGAAAAATQVFYQETGGTLIVNGIVSSTNAVILSFKGAGTIEMNGANTFSGGSTIGQANTTITVGNDSGLGTGTFNAAASGTIQAGGGARSISNAVSLSGGTLTVGGSNAFTFSGPVTVSGAASRTLTVNNTALTTFSGSVFLSEAAATGRTLLINGTGNVNITGQISNFNGAGTAGTLSKGGSGILTLSNTNTYSGGTLISGGTLVAAQNGALGTGNVSLTAANVVLTLQGAFNNYISDTATLSIGFTNDTVNLNFTGTDTINMLTLAGTPQAAGTYGAVGSGAQFELAQLNGTGTLTVLVPEPATYMLMGLGVLICAQQFRRRNKS